MGSIAVESAYQVGDLGPLKGPKGIVNSICEMEMQRDSKSSTSVVDAERHAAVSSVPSTEPLPDWNRVYKTIRAQAGFTPKKSKYPQRPKRRLLVRDELDLRTSAGKAFLQLIADISVDLGGIDQLSTVERALIEGFAGATVALTDLNVKLLRGDEAKVGVLTAHAAAINSLSKLAARLGTGRRAKLVPSLDEFLELRRQARGEPAQGSIE